MAQHMREMELLIKSVSALPQKLSLGKQLTIIPLRNVIWIAISSSRCSEDSRRSSCNESERKFYLLSCDVFASMNSICSVLRSTRSAENVVKQFLSDPGWNVGSCGQENKHKFMGLLRANQMTMVDVQRKQNLSLSC